MKKTNQKILRATAFSIMAAAMTVTALPVNAETANDSVSKNEDVFIVLNTDGSVNSTTVSDTLHSDSGFSNYDDKSNVADAQNLKSTDALTKSSDGYVWNTANKDIYYQGTYQGSLPLGVSISYQLDGKDISEEDLLGKSGHVKITMDLTNNKYSYYQVNGKTYKIAMPIAAVTGAMLNKDVFENVTISSGKVTSDSSHDIATAITIPGMKESLESIVTAKALETIDDYLNDQIVIEADANEYEAPEIMMAASTNIEELKTELGGTDLSSVWGDMDKLQSATNELITGTQSLYDGTTQLSDGASTLDQGASTLANGAASLKDGADEVADGASTLSAGAAALEAGLGQLSSNSADLNNGAKQIEDSIFTTATQQLNNSSAVKQSGATYTLTPDNYSQILGALLGITPEDADDAYQSIAASVRATAAGAALDDDQIKTLVYMTKDDTTTNDFSTKMMTEAARLAKAGKVQKAQGTVVAGLKNGQTAKATAMKDANVVAYLTAAEKTTGQTSTEKAYDALYYTINQKSAMDDATFATMLIYGADNLDMTSATFLADAGADLKDAQVVKGYLTNLSDSSEQAYINGVLNQIVAEYKQPRADLTNLLSQLNGLNKFVLGLKAYTAGVDASYAGSQKLASGAESLSAGADKVAAGAASVSNGATQLKTGIDTLSSGITTLNDGAKTLMDGMEQYNDEGISKLTTSPEIDDMKNATALLQQMKKTGDDYTNYSGISEGTTGSVKFVYKVKTVKTEKEKTASTESSDVTHVDDDLNVWQRLVNLFVFWK